MNSLRNLDPVTATMAGLGYRLAASEAGPMDSGSARYTNGMAEVVVWKARGQWFVGEAREVLEPLDCWRAFDDVAEFCQAVARYVQARSAEPGE